MRKARITIKDWDNFDNKITMVINDDKFTTQNSVQATIALHEGLSQLQIDKLESFKKSCKGLCIVIVLREKITGGTRVWKLMKKYGDEGIVF